MRKDIKTDNLLTHVVVGAAEQIDELRKELGTLGEVPFMMRERTRTERERAAASMTPADFQRLAQEEGPQALQKAVRQYHTHRGKR